MPSSSTSRLCILEQAQTNGSDVSSAAGDESTWSQRLFREVLSVMECHTAMRAYRISAGSDGDDHLRKYHGDRFRMLPSYLCLYHGFAESDVSSAAQVAAVLRGREIQASASFF